MSNDHSSKKVTVTSGLAFALLPQFKYSLAGLKELVPLFRITLAIVLSHAKLIRKDHPVLTDRHSATIADLMGEAWYTLRTTRATTTQWGVFSSIVVFSSLMISAVGMLVLRVGLGVGEVAHAQLFSAANDPYGNGGDTSITGGVQNLASPGTTVLFDSRVQNGATSDSAKDYAMMLLDKVLRQAAGNQNGGTMQNALASLMEVYNSAVLIIASVIIFWMIMSVVVDTAKTGTIGGGRHNMVWAPIRVVFALGIMIPLGSQGFSSGQYMVMKLAEWGSNLGSRAWFTYIQKVVTGPSGDSMLAGYSAQNVTNIVDGISHTLACQVTYNAFTKQSLSPDTPAPKDLVMPSALSYDSMTGRHMYTYTTASENNMCGQISYRDTAPSAPSADYTYPAYVTGLGGTTTPVAAAAPDFATYNRNVVAAITGDPWFIQNINNFNNSMSAALAAQVAPGGPALMKAYEFACTFVARRFNDGNKGVTEADNPVSKLTNPAADGANCNGKLDLCGGTYDAATGKDPNDSCQQAMVGMLQDAMRGAYDTNATQLDAAIMTGVLNENKARGWANMGLFFAEISAINVQLQSAIHPDVKITPGAAWEQATCGFFKGIGNWFANLVRAKDQDCVTDLQKQMNTVMADYSRWWDYTSAHPGSTPTDPMKTVTEGKNITPSTSAKDSGGGSSTDGKVMDIITSIIPKTPSPFIGLAQPVDGTKTGSFPMAELSNVGTSLIWSGIDIEVASTVAQMLAGATVEVLGIGGSLGGGGAFIFQTFDSVANAMIMAGMVLLFWLPAMPAIRVAFATLTWITAVFLAVSMVPIAALAHLTSEGEGLSGGARVAWVLWLNILLRPVLVVLGFVGAVLVYNSFAVYFNSMFGGVAGMVMDQGNGIFSFIGMFAYTAIYVMVLYTAANSSFKMMDLMADGMMTWMGAGAAAHSFDDNHGAAHGVMSQAGGMMAGMAIGSQGRRQATGMAGIGAAKALRNKNATPADPPK